MPPYDAICLHMQVITAEKSRRIAEYAFEYAVLNGRKRVTAIHKANIMKLSDGLFLRVGVARDCSDFCALSRFTSCFHLICFTSCCNSVQRSTVCTATALQECQKVAQDFPTVEFNSMIVDNTCMQLTGRPDQFDVMVRSPAQPCEALPTFPTMLSLNVS